MSTETCFFILSILHKLIVCLKSIKIWLVYHFSEHYLCSPMYTYCFILLLIWSCQFYSSHKNSRHRGNSLSPTVIILSVARATSLGIIFYSFHPDLPHAILFIFQLNTPAHTQRKLKKNTVNKKKYGKKITHNITVSTINVNVIFQLKVRDSQIRILKTHTF